MKMRDYDDYDEYEEYGSGGYQKNRKKKNKENYRSGKGHQSRRKANECWVELDEYSDLDAIFSEIEASRSPEPVEVKIPEVKHAVEKAPSPVKEVVQTPQPAQVPASFTAGPNTHTIKGNIIDFDRVAGVEKVENEHNGTLTYGIKFLFMGKKGLSRIAWFNKNIKERDSVYEKEYTFWQLTLKNKTE